MATRGTYQITMEYTEKEGKILTHRDISVCIYSQNNNYPSGAVDKFKNTFELQKELKEKLNNTDFIECFIAANIGKHDYIEITSSHDSHYDTAYSYDILISDDIYVKAYKLSKTGKELYYEGLINDFISNDAINFLGD